jgi:hypothetical protein
MKGKALIDESDGQRTRPPAQKESREARPDRPLDTPGAFADDQP